MNTPEKNRPWQKDHSRTISRREFLKISAGAVVAAGVVTVGLYKWGQENSGLSNEQELAQQTLVRAEREGNVTEFKLVNPDEKGGHINVRKSPAILNGNRIDEKDVGDKFNGFLVSSIGGREKYYPDLAGPWVAFEVEEDKIGFVYSGYAERTDGQELTKGLAIYNLTTGSAISWDSSSPE